MPIIENCDAKIFWVGCTRLSNLFRMDLFHCVSTPKLNSSVKTLERAKSEDKEPVAPPRGARRTSLPAHSNKKLSK